MKKCEICGRENRHNVCNSCRAKKRREKMKHEKCTHCGREGVCAKGLCQKHYKQYQTHGKFLDNNPRTISDPNEIIIYDDYSEIILYNKDNEETARSIIDLEDVEKVKHIKWSKTTSGYVSGKDKNEKNILLHRYLTECPDDMVVDHINHNTLDNRKNNLRVCTKQQNEMNKLLYSHNTSGVSGVSYYKRKEKWASKIIVNNKTIFLGYFDNKEDAIGVRKQAEKEYYGKYRHQE